MAVSHMKGLPLATTGFNQPSDHIIRAYYDEIWSD